MTSADRALVADWSRKSRGKIRIRLLFDDSEAGRRMKAFCRELSQLAPSVEVQMEPSEGDRSPEIRIGANVAYQVVPGGMELAPFLDALSGGGEPRATEALSPEVRGGLDRIRVPASLKVFVAVQCAFCPKMVSLLLELAAYSPFLHVTVIDGMLFPETAEVMGIRSVPTVILEERFRWTGSLDPGELVKVLLTRDVTGLGAETLKRMIGEGRAEDLAEMMIERGEIHGKFVDLLIDEKWPVRLGAMVAFETIVEKERGLASTIVEPLWSRFREVNDTVKGDVLHVLGMSGGRDVLPKLRAAAEGPYSEEVRAAARETLEDLSAEQGT